MMTLMRALGEADGEGDRIDDVVLLGATVRLVSQAVRHGGLLAHDIPDAIRSISAALREVTVDSAPRSIAPSTPAKPAVPVENSVQDDFIVSLIDGKPYKTLRRHLAGHGFTPESYRERYGLPADYPMTAPAYARRRSDLAKATGLGKRPPVEMAA